MSVRSRCLPGSAACDVAAENAGAPKRSCRELLLNDLNEIRIESVGYAQISHRRGNMLLHMIGSVRSGRRPLDLIEHILTVRQV